jgi:dienelactone hydrolase
MTRLGRTAIVGVTMVALAALLTPATWRTWHGFTLVARAAAPHGVLRELAKLDRVAVEERLLVVPVGGASMRARAYVPATKPRQTLLLVSGLHPAGIDEPRLIHLARTLAEANVLVVTPDIPELSRFDITPHLTDRIEAAALWLATESGFSPDGRIGLMGVSFSGGLAVVAAGRPALRERLRYVFSFGGHDDLRRVLDYFCAGGVGDASEEASLPESRPPLAVPHDYGVAIAVLTVADHLVPADQLTDFKEAVRRFLRASYLDRLDKEEAEREFDALRELTLTMPDPSATLLGYVNARDVGQLGPRLRPFVGEYAAVAALSPARSALPRAPVYLLHGKDDTVIPTAESERLAERLRHHNTPVRLLLTDLISHADADQPAHAADVVRLSAFWGDLLSR